MEVPETAWGVGMDRRHGKRWSVKKEKEAPSEKKKGQVGRDWRRRRRRGDPRRRATGLPPPSSSSSLTRSLHRENCMARPITDAKCLYTWEGSLTNQNKIKIKIIKKLNYYNYRFLQLIYIFKINYKIYLRYQIIIILL